MTCSRPEGPSYESHRPSVEGLNLARIAQVACVTTAMFTMVAGVQPARAEERVWKPRRHYRRMGERISDTWAEEAVEVSLGRCFL